jgi:hypothetical protein
VYIYVHVHIHPSVRPSINQLSIYISIYLFNYLSIYIHTCVSIHLTLHLFTYLCMNLSVHLSTHYQSIFLLSLYVYKYGNAKANHVQAEHKPKGSRRFRLPHPRQSAQVCGKGLNPPFAFILQEIFLVFIYVKALSWPQGHNAAGRSMSMKHSNNNIGNRTCDLLDCSTVPEPTVPPRNPLPTHTLTQIYILYIYI